MMKGDIEANSFHLACGNGVGVIIVNWNTGRLLAQCLRSLKALPEQETISRVVVVDNASSDDSLSRARAAVSGWDKVTFIEQDHNAGFAAANNAGVKACDQESDIWLLNPDTVVKPGCLAALAGVLDRNKKAAVTGPRLLNADGTGQASVRRFPGTVVLAGNLLKLPRIWRGWPAWRNYLAEDFDYGLEQKADQVMGASLLARREVWDRLGGLDEGFWIWFEEVDFCRRVYDAGWEVWYTPTGETVHYGGASFYQLSGLRKSWPWVKSSLRYAQKHLGWLSWAALLLAVPGALVLAVCAQLFQRRQKEENMKRL